MADIHIPPAVLLDERLERVLVAIDGPGSRESAETIAANLGIKPRQFWRSISTLTEIVLARSRERMTADDFQITPEGESVVDDIQDSYKRGVLRDATIRHDVLKTLAGSSRHSSDAIAESWPGRDLEPAPSVDEVRYAGEWLKERGLANVTRANGGAWIAVGVTGMGQSALNSGDRLIDSEKGNYVTNSHTTNYNQQGSNIGGQAFGDYNEVHGSVTVDRRLVNIREALDAAADAATAANLPPEVVAAIDDARAVAGQDAPRPSMLRTLIDYGSKLVSSFGTAAGNATVQEITEHLAQAQTQTQFLVG